MTEELLERIVAALVDHPDHIKIYKIRGKQSSVFELMVAPEDLGRVIGKQGQTVQAIRTILVAASAKLKKRALLEIVERRIMANILI